MGDFIQVKLDPLGEVLRVEAGMALKDVLFRVGVEFPCGGQGRCRGCRIRVLEGRLPVTAEDEARLDRADLEAGWRLACRAVAPREDLTLELAQWEAAVLGDETGFAFTPEEGWGVAVDLGTTTIVAQLVDLETGRVLGVKTALNPQARFGSDIMSRVHHAVVEKGQAELTAVIREAVGRLVKGLQGGAGASTSVAGGASTTSGASPAGGSTGSMESTGGLEPSKLGDDNGPAGSAGPSAVAKPLRKVVLVGNTVMHHLFCGCDMTPLAAYPYETEEGGTMRFRARELGWSLAGDPVVTFLPCLGSFVGSDLLAGIAATGLHEKETPCLLVDLGTNGEILLGNRDGILCASAAAGPAFEAGRIGKGMRASIGAISQVRVEEGKLACSVIGNTEARGLCGSGLVDAVACGLELGLIDESGRLAGEEERMALSPEVDLTQGDIRELQLAKGAIAAGIRILLKMQSLTDAAVQQVYLAGAFGNYVDRASAGRIGLIRFPGERVRSSGNTALLGAKMALFDKGLGEAKWKAQWEAILSRIEHVSLSTDPAFQEIFMAELAFPV